jgi:intracellular sulfur oxidation DsrE/DsrF family protein
MSRPHAKMLLIAMSGLEDTHRLTAPFRHAALLKKTGKAEVAVVVFGRAVVAMSKDMKSVSEATRAAIKEARDAGVHLYVCEHALEQAGIPREAVIAEAELVPQRIVKIADLVAEGYSPIQY